MTFSEFSEAVKAVVVGMGSNPVAIRPQCYAVINDVGDINKDMKSFRYFDKESPLFYSKAWADAGYPSEVITKGAFVYLYKEPSVISQPFQQKQYLVEEQVRLYVVDEVNTAEANAVTDKNRRHESQVIEDCERMLAELLQKLPRTDEVRRTLRYTRDLNKDVIRALGQQNLSGVAVSLTLKVRYCIS